jgi:hypothetical protein
VLFLLFILTDLRIRFVSMVGNRKLWNTGWG